jgi:hypothetical protein
VLTKTFEDVVCSRGFKETAEVDRFFWYFEVIRLPAIQSALIRIRLLDFHCPQRLQETAIDINDPMLGLSLLVATVAIFFVARSMREYMPLVRRKRSMSSPPGARELEVKIKLSAGPAVLDDLRELAGMYAKAHQYEQSMQYCVQAIQVAENHFGKNSEELVPILKLYSRVLKQLHRHAEAANAKKRADQCATK